jgi:hypothetical protein
LVALAAGNHDYDGHRWKAMHAVKAALVLLDNFVLKHDAAELKAATRHGRDAVAQAEEAAKRTPKVHEPQPASDALLGQAAQLLGEVAPLWSRTNGTPFSGTWTTPSGRSWTR